MKQRPALCAVGLSFRSAPVALRERLAFRPAELPGALAQLAAQVDCSEAAILSTCNRTEVYLVGEAGDAELPAKARGFLSRFHGVPEAEFARVLYELRDAEAAAHLFGVAASLDSQVLGETEILGQTREAYRAAAEAGLVGPVLRAVFERALFLAKEVRGAGGVGQGQASISSAAVRLAEKIFEGLAGHRALVLGTGEMAAGIVRSLRAAGVTEVLAAGRSAERTAQFAEQTGSRCGPLEDLPKLLGAADLVLVSTAAPHYVLSGKHLEPARKLRHGKPLLVLDISVPRNVDPEVHRLADVFLYNIDDLEEVAREGRAQREQAAQHWRPRLAEEARAVLSELRDESADQVAQRLLRMAAGLREAELEELRRGGALDAAAQAQAARALERLQARLLYGPLAALKGAARQEDGARIAEQVRRLFRLEPEDGSKKDEG